jgi:hypothetical protein
MARTIQIDYGTPYEAGTTKLHDIGQRAEDPDGSVFHYTLMGGTVGVANKIYQGAAAIGAHQDTEHTVALVVGDTQIKFHDDGTALTVDEAQGGHITVESAADLGHIYRIKSNTVTDTAETFCQLEDGVTVQFAVPVAGGNHLTLQRSTWLETLIGISGVNTAPNAGVPRVIIAISGYGWMQTRGVASCVIKSDSVLPLVGNGLRNSSGAVGAVSLLDETAAKIDYGHVGYCMATSVDGGFSQIYLQIE